MNMIHHRIHSSALGLAAVVLAFVALPFTACQSGSNKSSTAEAVAMINAASSARDYDRLNTLADSLGQAGKLSKGESNYWQGYAHYQMGQRELAEYFWQEAIRVTEKSDDDRLLGILRSCSFESTRQVIETITAEVEAHRNGAEPSDDLTMMCLNIKNA